MLKPTFKHILSALCVLLMITGSAHAAELIISAAASLNNAFQDIKPAFEKKYPDTTLTLNFGASGALLKQIEAGAPADVFVSADQETMDKAKDLVATTTRTNLVSNSLVMIAPLQNTAPVATLEDLKKTGVEHIAIGNPDSVPAGRYTKAVLTQAGLYETLTPKFVLAENVRQALDYVVRGEVQAGFVFSTDAAGKTDKVKIVQEVTGHAPIVYPIAVVAASTNKEAAQNFITYLQSADSQAVLIKYGFKKP